MVTHLRPFPEISFWINFPPPHGTHLRPFPEILFWVNNSPLSAWRPPSSISRNFILDQHPIFPLAKLLHFFDIRKPAHNFVTFFISIASHLRPFPEISFWTNIPHPHGHPPSSISRNFILDAYSHRMAPTFVHFLKFHSGRLFSSAWSPIFVRFQKFHSGRF